MRVRRFAAIASIVAVIVGALVTAPAAQAGVASARRAPDPHAVKARAAQRDAMTAAVNARIGAAHANAISFSPSVFDNLNDQSPVQTQTGQLPFTTFGQGDIRYMRAAVNNDLGVPSLFVSLTVSSGEPAYFPDWVQNDTFAVWFVDKNGDDTPEYEIDYVNYNGIVFGDVYSTTPGVDGKLPHLCDAAPVASVNGDSYGVYTKLSCLGNLKNARVFAAMQYSDGVYYALDFAPDLGWVNVPTKIAPTTPGTPAATAAPASLDVTWGAPAATLWPVTDYVVQYSLKSPVSWKTFNDGVSTSRSARVTGLLPGKSYMVRVASHNQLGNSAFSKPSLVKVPLKAGVLPSATGQPKGVPGAGKVVASWTAPTKPGSSPLKDYDVEYSLNAGKTWVRVTHAVSAARSVTIGGLSAGTRMVIRVRARTFAGVGPWSKWSIAAGPFNVPGAARAPSITRGDSSAAVSWLAPVSNGGSAVTSYRVSYRPAAVQAPIPAPQIVGGTNGSIASTPWQVRVFINNGSLCGGSLIDPQWVVTAAHCTVGATADKYVVHAGFEFQTDMNALNGYKVDKVVVHPAYTAAAHHDDIALLHLTKPATGVAVHPIALATDNTGPAAGSQAIISGWGRLFDGANEVPGRLQRATVNVLADAGVAGSCAGYGATFDPAKMICAGIDGSVDTCQGDSGGPLAQEAFGTRLIGITSFGNGCAQLGFPGVYTRVSTYVPWIQDNIEAMWPHVDVTCPAAPNCLSATLSGLTPGVTYEVRVRAKNAYGYGALLNGGTVQAATVPGAPTAVTAVATIGGADVQWTAPASSGAATITSYEVSADDGATWVAVDATGLPAQVIFSFTGLTPGVPVHFVVRAINVIGKGAWSTASSDVTPLAT